MNGIQWSLFWFVGAVGSIWATDWQIFPSITTAVLGYMYVWQTAAWCESVSLPRATRPSGLGAH